MDILTRVVNDVLNTTEKDKYYVVHNGIKIYVDINDFMKIGLDRLNGEYILFKENPNFPFEENSKFYEGEFCAGLFHGKGIKYYKNGKYEGEFNRGLHNGKGIIYDSNEEIKYEGEFKNDLFHGKGIRYYKEGKYEGEFNSGLRHGEGVLYFPNGKILYKGQFNRGLRHGKGILYNPNGQIKYEGEFKNDLIRGKGILYNPNGQIIYEGAFFYNSYFHNNRLYYFDENLDITQAKKRKNQSIIQISNDSQIKKGKI